MVHEQSTGTSVVYGTRPWSISQERMRRFKEDTMLHNPVAERRGPESASEGDLTSVGRSGEKMAPRRRTLRPLAIRGNGTW